MIPKPFSCFHSAWPTDPGLPSVGANSMQNYTEQFWPLLGPVRDHYDTDLVDLGIYPRYRDN